MRGIWRWSRKSGTPVVAVLVLGGLGVVGPLLELGLPFLALAAWPAAATLIRGEGWPRFLPAATLAAIVLGAHYAPVKMVDAVFSRPVALPRPVMTIGEIRDPINAGLPRFVPLYVSVAGKDFDDLAIRFPRTDMSLGEFVRTIEQRTPLRHCFLSCGNGSSILYGLYPIGLTFQARN